MKYRCDLKWKIEYQNTLNLSFKDLREAGVRFARFKDKEGNYRYIVYPNLEYDLLSSFLALYGLDKFIDRPAADWASDKEVVFEPDGRYLAYVPDNLLIDPKLQAELDRCAAENPKLLDKPPPSEAE